MSNRLEELHSQCKKYHLKKAVKLFGLLMASSIITIGVYFAWVGLDKDQTSVTSKSNMMTEEKPQSDRVVPEYKVGVSDAALEAAVKKMKRSSETKRDVKSGEFEKVSSQKQNIFQSQTAVSKKAGYFKPEVKEQSIEAWIEKYHQKKSYTVAIYIAKQYYLQPDYKQAGIWAKRANQIDRNKEEAWLYYAKSVYALGDASKAKRILNIYLQYKKSTKAELLLSEWNQ